VTPSGANSERHQIEQAIIAQEKLRGSVDDAIVDATIATLKKELTALDASPEQQRKLATMLFMDIVDHTALTRGMDSEDQMAVIDPLIARLAKKITEFGDHVARYQGGGFKAVFGLPVARENDPEDFLLLIMDVDAKVVIPPRQNRKGSREYDKYQCKPGTPRYKVSGS
jgi:class 3 adenylate cyclase